ncbi:LuxR C-terminal-related transcriptional regulator [Georgenia sp. SYP-B2076]|uniref:helix-turn-helix transcriptional regulator n=1 Tax=Georgenia sp. SYP-B2076 TaxID=2495881 RepID=UPI000F8EBE6F|nr:LuxR C-terminal-related transcriptional regulator [Georgenia sp. SYP-B2076]
MGEAAPSVVLGRPRAPRGVVVEQELVDLLAIRSPLTVVRGPRGYGKTTLVDAWLSRLAGDRDQEVVYLRLTQACNDGPTFWDGLARALSAAGVIELPDGADPHHEAVRQLAARTEPLTLVIDDYHHAGRRDVAADIDDELVELVRQNDQLYLVVATRAIRVLETTGSLSIDVTIISPQELRLSPGGVAALAARTGVPIGDAQAARLSVGFGGWPAAIRDVLVRSRRDGGHINLALADQYIASMVRDLRHEAVRTFMLRTAVPEEFDAELAQLVAPSEKVLAILRNVRSQGLLHEEIRDERRVYSYAPLVRQALVRVLTESRPQQLREVHSTLMDWHVKTGDHVRAIVHAIHAGDWATVELLMEQHWPHLITQEPWALVAAAQLIPPEIAAAHPRLRVARDELAQALPPGTAGPGVPPWPTGDLRGITAELQLQRRGATPGGTTLALLQWGVAAVLAGDLATALYAFGRTRDHGQAAGDDAALVPATAGLALTHALLGDVEIARGWLADAAVADVDAAPEGQDLAGVGVRIARALVALDGLDEDVDDAVLAMGERHRRDEIWALTVYIRALHAGMSREPGEVARWAANLRAARHYLPRGGLAEMLVRSGLVETLTVGGMLVAARQAAEDMQPSVVSFATLARLSLADGDPARAVAHARTGLAHPRLTQRSAMECHLVLAGAHHALGERVAARRAFDQAIESAYGSGQRRPLLAMRHSTFLQLAAGDRGVLDLWPARLTPSTEEGPAVAAARPAEPLSRRERQVLDSLARNAGAVGIARELGLSVNTVKTHLRAVYRKLGVGSRDEALVAASTPRSAALPGIVTWAQG